MEYYRHFGHPHSLKFYKEFQKGDIQPHCSSCESSIFSGSVFGCPNCNFFLHQQCAKAARAVEHPSHPLHHLTLLPYPTHSSGLFCCDACGRNGTAFSYSCPLCDFNVHIPCANLPNTLYHPTTHPHELKLSYGLPQYGDKRHVCSICKGDLDYKLWTYNCFGCDYRTHSNCGVGSVSRAVEKAECGGRTVAEEVVGCGGSREEINNVNVVGDDAGQLLEIQSEAMRNQLEMYKLQLEMERIREISKMMASFNLNSFHLKTLLVVSESSIW